jgi:co-chaperonin GroES (HSP10)
VINTTGINPTEFKVLIAPKPVEEKIGSIIMPDQFKDSEKYATVEGHIIAASPLAFTYARQDEWDEAGAVKPKAGDRVLYAKYAGVRVKSPKDGQEYLLINDKDLVATVEE